MEKIHQVSERPVNPTHKRRFSWLTFLLIVSACLLWLPLRFWADNRHPRERRAPSFEHLANHCSSCQAIPAPEFYERQAALAKILYKLGAQAYIVEPGPNALYFANISLSQWRLSERPFLLVISPEVTSREIDEERDRDDPVDIKPIISIITPRFEESRARLLEVAAKGNVNFAVWAEDADPYATAVSVIRNVRSKEELGGNDSAKIIIDEGARYFIAEGIKRAANGAEVEIASAEVQALRERKSPAELSLLKCANEVTLLALREVRKYMFIGIYESEARELIRAALSAAGLEGGDGLVLFGENAALPHGSGTNRQLGEEDLALFDIGGSLHGYYSDLTRTIALPQSRIPSHKLELWYTVLAAQSAAFRVAKEGTSASHVDSTARSIIDFIGAGEHFTHRLGHGIGLQGHESPYLRGGNDVPLEKGNVCSNEPGIYIEGEVGIRLEDCFVIDEVGRPQFLTAGVGGQATSPWEP